MQLQGQLPDRAWVDKATGAATVSAGLRLGQLAATLHLDDSEEEEAEGEYVFVIDRSGSMAGASILQAREALALCVSALPLGARFQIVGFGSSHAALFPDGPAAYDDARKAEALAHCRGLAADMGGTEILPALQAVASAAATKAQAKAPGGRPRQVFVVTDGQVSNTAGVLAFVRDDHRRAGTRYFGLGIGAGASRALVKGIAEAGAGTSAFVVDGERLQRKVMAQMNRALEPGLTDVRVALSPPLRLLEAGGGFSPKEPRPLFTGSRLLYYGALDPTCLAGVAEGEGLIAVTGTAPGKGKGKATGEKKGAEASIPVPLRFLADAGEGRMLQALATRAALRDLEAEAEAEGEGGEEAKAAAKARAVALSEASGVLCKFTSYVAVAERTDAATGALQPVHLPLAFVNKDNQRDPWSYMQRQQHMQRQHTGAAMPMMAMACPAPMAYACASPPMASPLVSLASGGARSMLMMKKRGAPPPGVHRVLGHTAKVMDTTAEADDAAMAASAMAVVDSNVGAANNGFFPHHPRFLGQPLKFPVVEENNKAMDHVALVARQKAAGNWAWQEEDAADNDDFLPLALGVESRVKLEAALDTQVAPLGAWATALVLAKLEKDFAAFAEEWEAAARKARRWLGKQLAAAAKGMDADAFVKRAGEVLAGLA